MSYVKGDPYWLTARRDDACSKCGAFIHRGDSAWYWPRGKKIECAPCGATSESRFIAETAMETWA